MDKLNLLKILIAVVDHGSFAQAANALALSPSAVSKAIGRLESDLQIHLFYRTNRSVTLTPTGQQYVTKARALITDLTNYEAYLLSANKTPQGSLTVNLPVTYGRHYIVPMLSEFNTRYPDIDLKLKFDDNYLDMVENRIDVSIRTGKLEDSNLIARQLSPMDFLICASPSFLEKHPDITPATYDNYPWIRFRFKQTGRIYPILTQQGDQLIKSNPGEQFVVDDGSAMAELCVQGLGLAQLPHYLANHWLKTQQLVVIAPYARPTDLGVWILYPKHEFLPAATQCFTQYVIEKIQQKEESAYHTWAEKY